MGIFMVYLLYNESGYLNLYHLCIINTKYNSLSHSLVLQRAVVGRGWTGDGGRHPGPTHHLRLPRLLQSLLFRLLLLVPSPKVVSQSSSYDYGGSHGHADDQHFPAGGAATDLPVIGETYEERTAPTPQDGPEGGQEECEEFDHVCSVVVAP